MEPALLLEHRYEAVIQAQRGPVVERVFRLAHRCLQSQGFLAVDPPLVQFFPLGDQLLALLFVLNEVLQQAVVLASQEPGDLLSLHFQHFDGFLHHDGLQVPHVMLDRGLVLRDCLEELHLALILHLSRPCMGG